MFERSSNIHAGAQDHTSSSWVQRPVSKATDVSNLTPKGQSPFFGLFLKFGQAIVDAIFVQKFSNFLWTCGLVLASRRTNFYKMFVQKISNFLWTCGLVLASRRINFYEIPISGLGVMPQKQNSFDLRVALGIQIFIF
jgi:hypothetical protein